MYNDDVYFRASPEVVQKQVDLLHLGLQSKVRAVMAIYQVDRSDAELILKEIDAEQKAYNSSF